MKPPPDNIADSFERSRDRLFSLAYRMTGSVPDAQNVVQDTWVRWMGVDAAQVRDPLAYWIRTATRLSLDLQRSARARRERYVGVWLPDPLLGTDETGPDAAVSEREQVDVALMLALERLSPSERAAFLLKDVFDLDMQALSVALSKTPAACRQLLSRARKHLGQARPRYVPRHATTLVEAFWEASQSGDVEALTQLLVDDVEVRSDGGGRIPSALNALHGRTRATRFFVGLVRKYARGGSLIRFTTVHGAPGIVSRDAGGNLQVTSFDFDESDRLRGIWIVRNPDKLCHVGERDSGPRLDNVPVVDSIS